MSTPACALTVGILSPDARPGGRPARRAAIVQGHIDAFSTFSITDGSSLAGVEVLTAMRFWLPAKARTRWTVCHLTVSAAWLTGSRCPSSPRPSNRDDPLGRSAVGDAVNIETGHLWHAMPRASQNRHHSHGPGSERVSQAPPISPQPSGGAAGAQASRSIISVSDARKGRGNEGGRRNSAAQFASQEWLRLAGAPFRGSIQPHDQ
jgi:hypothetical protein